MEEHCWNFVGHTDLGYAMEDWGWIKTLGSLRMLVARVVV